MGSLQLLIRLSLIGLASGNSALEQKLRSIIEQDSRFWNVSLSVAFAVDDGAGGLDISAAAAGYDDHATGKVATTKSMYPSGSATKTYTSVAAMRLVDAGKLDLDKPVYQYVDSWLAKQLLMTV